MLEQQKFAPGLIINAVPDFFTGNDTYEPESTTFYE